MWLAGSDVLYFTPAEIHELGGRKLTCDHTADPWLKADSSAFDTTPGSFAKLTERPFEAAKTP